MASPDESQSLLSGLRGIHIPPPPDDDTALILVLLLVFAVALTLLIYSLVKRLSRNRNGKHEILVSLQKIRTIVLTEPERSSTALTQAAATLRQTVARHEGREKSQLTGARYLSTLDNLFKTDFFGKGTGNIFGESIYQTDATPDEVLTTVDGLRQVIHKWK